jgi:hypothetical protein
VQGDFTKAAWAKSVRIILTGHSGSPTGEKRHPRLLCAATLLADGSLYGERAGLHKNEKGEV